MKKVLAIILALAMVLGLAACGTASNTNTAPANNNAENTNAAGNDENTAGNENTAEPAKVYNVGMVCIGDDNAAYDRNFYMAAEEAKTQLAAKGINIIGGKKIVIK